jgi:hypothetical protein
MKRLMMTLCCVCAVAAVQAAQTGSMDKDKAKAETTAATAAKKGAVTMTGCVAAGTEPGHYMLTKAAKEGETAGATTASYALMGGELKPHVGHKVEVTGTLDAKGMSKDSMSKDTMAKETDKAMGTSTLHVKSVKMLAATCS